jgi:hypothetical protein
LNKQNVEKIIEDCESAYAKEEMIRWVSELIHEINNIDHFFIKKQNEYKNEFLEMKNKYLTYKYRDKENMNRSTLVEPVSPLDSTMK